MSDFSPIRLAQLPAAFDHSEFIFEVKYDGFRAFADVNYSGARRISRRANVYKSFPRLGAGIAEALNGRSAVLDGESVHFGTDGKPLFYQLLRRRTPQHFCAFDLLSLDGRDLRSEPLLKRKRLANQAQDYDHNRRSRDRNIRDSKSMAHSEAMRVAETLRMRRARRLTAAT